MYALPLIEAKEGAETIPSGHDECTFKNLSVCLQTGEKVERIHAKKYVPDTRSKQNTGRWHLNASFSLSTFCFYIKPSAGKRGAGKKVRIHSLFLVVVQIVTLSCRPTYLSNWGVRERKPRKEAYLYCIYRSRGKETTGILMGNANAGGIGDSAKIQQRH